MEVSTDIMFVNKLKFLVRNSKGPKINMIEYLSNNSVISLVNYNNKMVSYYKSKGLHVRTMFVDPDFQLLKNNVVSTLLNTTGARDHVP